LLPQDIVLELSWNDDNSNSHTAYAGWSGRSSNKPDVIEIDPQFGTAINLYDGQKILMGLYDTATEARTVSVEPCTVDDWEIVERRADYLEGHFIQQQRVVYPNQIVVLWINSNLTRLKIVEISPKSNCAKLSENSEIIVTPKPRKILNSILKSPETKDTSHVYCLRLLPAEFLSDGLIQSDANLLPPHRRKDSEEKSDNGDKNSASAALYVKVLENPNVILGHVVLCNSIMDSLDAEKFDIIRLSHPQSNPSQVSNITIHLISSPFQSTSLKHNNGVSLADVSEEDSFRNALMTSFKAWIERLSDSSEIVLTNRMKLSLKVNEINIVVTFGGNENASQNDVHHGRIDSSDEFTILMKRQLLNVEIEIGENVSMPDHKILKQPSVGSLPLLGGVEKLIRRLQDYTRYCIGKVSLRNSLSVPAQQQTSVHAFLITSHLFSEVAQLNSPTKSERCDILKAIMSSGPELAQKSVPHVDLLSVASDCEGYLAADLKVLVERAIHEGAIRQLQGNVDGSEFLLTQEDFHHARKGFVPFSLRDVKLHTSDVNWTDIGGLDETRKVLLETLEWPTKYASIFANCPLRLRSGGHDSTGVTDRVVNQMLTQMDGAEGLDGVYVLAATSRPDLIDPALLRPGRLDKSLFCNMPTSRERLEILMALSRKVDLGEDVDLNYYAKRCQGYSGADLQALLYNAHLEAIHETIDAEKSIEKVSSSEDSELQFTSFNMNSKKTITNFTAAERTQTMKRLSLIKKGFTQKEVIKTDYESQNFSQKKPKRCASTDITNLLLEEMEKCLAEFQVMKLARGLLYAKIKA
ncbi:9508_t:CDS:10, partial [Acaulospora colombiana]